MRSIHSVYPPLISETKMKSLFLSVLFVCFAVVAQASPVGMFVAGDEPEPTDPGFGFAEVKAEWDKGTAMSQATLTGKWSAVAVATHANCKTLINLASQDSRDDSGIKNSDQSPALELTFSIVNKAPLPGGEPAPVFSVTIANLGTEQHDQGPYRANATAPNFATWGYKGSIIEKSLWFDFTCRSFGRDHMICMLAAKGQYDDAQQKTCSQEPQGAGIIYRKATR